jgi:hypothetical protein
VGEESAFQCGALDGRKTVRESGQLSRRREEYSLHPRPKSARLVLASSALASSVAPAGPMPFPVKVWDGQGTE